MLDVHVLKLLYQNANRISSPSEIAKTFNIPNSTVTNAINRLEKKGLLARKLNQNDLRIFHLVLTQEGERAMRNHHEEERKLISKIMNLLDNDETELMLQIGHKILKEL